MALIKRAQQSAWPLLAASIWLCTIVALCLGAPVEALAQQLPPESAAPENLGALMDQARNALQSENYPAAIQLYSKVLRAGTETPYAQDAQEFLGIARERNGQTAHAAAEYRRYLDLYPNQPGAARVQQRLEGLAIPPSANSASTPVIAAPEPSRWSTNGAISQYYWRDTLSMDNREDIVQSALLTDVDLLARHDGDRFAFESRVTAGNYYDLEDTEYSPGTNNRVYYMYADMEDTVTDTSVRLGRQRMYSSGILGRFDGVQAGWRFRDNMEAHVMAGYPAYSSSDASDTDIYFYGTSLDILDIGDLADVSVFYNQQTVNGINDRQAIGGEVRLFTDRASLITSLDFDINYSELNNFVAIGNWATTDSLTLNAMLDYRRSPYLLAENALVGQSVDNVGDLLNDYTEDEIRQLAEDRSAEVTTVTVGFSTPVYERFQLNGDVSMVDYTDTTESGGVPAITGLGTDYYFNLNLVGASLIKEGDTNIIGLRYQDGNYVKSTGITFDTRYPVTQLLRINPRLLLAKREMQMSNADEVLIIPALRLFFDVRRQTRLEFEIGSRFSTVDSSTGSTDSQSWFVYTGYRSYF